MIAMALFIIYILKWAIALTLLHSLYGLTLRRETFHTLNRVVLLGILVLSAVLPLCHFNIGHETWLSQGFERLEESLAFETVTPTDEASRSTEAVLPYSSSDDQGTIIPRSSNNHSEVIEQPADVSVFSWATMLLWLYLLGTVACWLMFLRSLAKVIRLIRRSQCIEERDGVRILLCPELRNSCSWMQWVMLAPEDRPTPEGPVFTHELAHVRLGHSWDKILAEITCRTLWFLPFAWMLREDLSDVHEYEADRAVLQTGIDIREYNQLLILKAVRPGLQPVVNAFNQSRIKKRITMMYKRKSNKWCAAKALYLLPMGMLSLVAFAKPVNQVSSRFGVPTEETVGDESTYQLDFSKPAGHAKKMVALDAAVLIDGEPATPVNGNWLADIDLNNVTISKDIEGNITRVNLRSKADNDSIYEVVEVLPKYPGDEPALYQYLHENIKYPAVALEYGVQGRVMVTFVVEKDGTLSDVKAIAARDLKTGKELTEVVIMHKRGNITEEDAQAELQKRQAEGVKAINAEGVRVVKAMPKRWEPGRQGGKPVRTRFILPLVFRLK